MMAFKYRHIRINEFNGECLEPLGILSLTHHFLLFEFEWRDLLVVDRLLKRATCCLTVH